MPYNPCGHDAKYIVGSDEGTNYCSKCEEVARKANMANQYRNWTTEAAFLRKQANKIRGATAGCDDDAACDVLENVALALEARADALTKKQKDKING